MQLSKKHRTGSGNYIRSFSKISSLIVKSQKNANKSLLIMEKRDFLFVYVDLHFFPTVKPFSTICKIS